MRAAAVDDSLDSSCAAWGPPWLPALEAQSLLGCSLPFVQCSVSLGGMALLRSAAARSPCHHREGLPSKKLFRLLWAKSR